MKNYVEWPFYQLCLLEEMRLIASKQIFKRDRIEDNE